MVSARFLSISMQLLVEIQDLPWRSTALQYSTKQRWISENC